MHNPGPRDFPLPHNEADRLASLYRLELLDAPPGERFDRIARLAGRAMAAPVALVTLLDADEQQMCAALGTDIGVVERADTFCTHTILEPDDLLVVPDTHDDARFSSLPSVSAGPHIRFYAGVAIHAPDGQKIGSMCVLDVEPRTLSPADELVLRDLGALVERELLHTSLAMTDSLTGLANHRAFMAASERFLSLGRRRSEPVSIIFADVNGLKAVNDRLGHVDGDDLLRRAAAAISSSTRASDVVARLGGDEFAAVLYDADGAQAEAVISKIRHGVAADNDGRPSAVELSIALGAATARPADTITELVARADAAMFSDKQSSK